MTRTLSKKIFENSEKVIPGGVNSPARSFPAVDLSPLIIEKGEGSLIWDADGKEYIDYCASWGALILGHAHPKVVQAACDQVKKGSSFGTATEVEQKMAEKVVSHYPSIEMIRFVSSGTEAVMTAVRIARGFTGRDLLVKFDGCYHGHADTVLSKRKGIPEQPNISLPYNDIDAFKELMRKEKPAAVLIEPIAGNMGLVPASREFLEVLREETEKSGTVLIFDEVITGYRVGLTGAQGYFGIKPDLTTLGKIVGGGFPAAAVGGSREIMQSLSPIGEVFQAGTLSGNPVAMHAGLAVLEEIEKPDFYEAIEEKTKSLVEGTGWTQIGSMFAVPRENFLQRFTKAFQAGIYIPPSPDEVCFVSATLTDEMAKKTRDNLL